MIKNILMLIFFLTIMSNSQCLSSDFRESDWGMSKEVVKSSEKSEPIYSDEKILRFKGKVANLPVDIIFVFEDDRLKSGSYQFIKNRVNPNIYIEDYIKITQFLEIKYGKPDYKKEIWYNDLYKEKKGFHGLAISIGHFKLISKWNDNKSTIIHRLSGNNYNVFHSIDYFQKLFSEDTSETIEIEELKGL